MTTTQFFGASAVPTPGKPYNGLEVDDDATEGAVTVTLPDGHRHKYLPFRTITQPHVRARHSFEVAEGGAIIVSLFEWAPAHDSHDKFASSQRVVRVYGPTGYSQVEGTEGVMQHPADAERDSNASANRVAPRVSPTPNSASDFDPAPEGLSVIPEPIRRSGSLAD